MPVATAYCVTLEGRNTNTEVKIQKTTRNLIYMFAIANSSTYPVSLKGFSVTLAALKWFPIFATSSCCSLFQPRKTICWYQIAASFITYLGSDYCNIYISVLIVKQLISLFCHAWLGILGIVKVSKLVSFSWLKVSSIIAFFYPELLTHLNMERLYRAPHSLCSVTPE